MEARRQAFAESDAQHRRWGDFRLFVLAALLVLVYWRLWWGVLFCVLLLFALGVKMQALEDARSRWRRTIEFYETGLERLAGRWAGKGLTGEAFLPAEHLYARDLDLFGIGSLFELLCRARTRMGQSKLAQWLLGPAPFGVVVARQEAVRELSDRLDLREDLAVIVGGNAAEVNSEALAAWGEAPGILVVGHLRPLFWLLSILGLLAIAAFVALLVGVPLPGLRIFALAMVVICGSVFLRYRAQSTAVLEGAEHAVHELALLSAVLRRFESENFVAPELLALQREMQVEGEPPSVRIAQLRRWMDLADSRDHVLLKAAGPVILWDLHLAIGLEAWREKSGPALRRWMDAVAEMEALVSFAGYRYENESDVFPELVAEGVCLEGVGMSHPLMPRTQAVANDLRLGEPLQALVVSGSNMSGKSTLMRTVGVNVVLAQAGGVVRATSLRLTSLQVGASIQTHDSLAANTSRFYAEILRLRDILQQAGEGPVLFLIDEVLSGTNSHDRRIGAEAILRGLVQRGAIGLTSTHDLALTRIVEELGGTGGNVHFEDQLVDGVMRFDYKMREGVVTHSNAIALMRAVGLEV